MTRCLLITISLSLSIDLLYSQTPTAEETVRAYSNAQKRVLVRSTAVFANILAQGQLESDSAMLIAFRLTGLPFLVGYSDDEVTATLSLGAGLINGGKISEATRLIKKLSGNAQLQLSIELATWYLHRNGADKKDLDSANQYIQNGLKLSTLSLNEVKRYECLSLLGEYYQQRENIAESHRIFSQMIASSQSEGNKKVTAVAWHHLGKPGVEIDSLSLSYLYSSLALYRELRIREKEIEVLWDIADHHRKTNNVLLHDDLVQILEIQRSTGFKHTLYAEHLLAYILSIRNQYLDCMVHSKAALDNMNWSEIQGVEGTFYMRMGTAYMAFGRDDDALVWFKKGLENGKKQIHIFWYKNLFMAHARLMNIGRFDEALTLAQGVINESPPITPWEKAQVLDMVGWNHEKLGNYNQADEIYRSFFNLMKENRDIDPLGEMAGTYLGIAKFYLSITNIKWARAFLEKEISLYRPSDSKTALVEQNYSKFLLDSINSNFGSALQHYIQYKSADDESENQEQRKKFEELTIKYDMERKDQDIKLLEQDKQIQHATILQATYTRNWTLGAVGLLLVIVGLLLYNARLKQKTNKKLKTQGAEIERQNFKLLHLVDEKDWLVKEIHHRVKNNLQIVMSLLNSQSAYIDNDVALTAIHDSQHRVQAMSLIHQKLYNSDNVSSIDMSLYIRELISYLTDSFNTGQRIRFEYDVESLEMDVSDAVPLGLILNEAITNAIKYAFPDDGTGVIRIVLSHTDNAHCLLSISDNGIGIPPHLDNKKTDSLGMSLMKGLTDDLEGNLSIETDNGTKIKLLFSRKPAGNHPDSLTKSLVLNET